MQHKKAFSLIEISIVILIIGILIGGIAGGTRLIEKSKIAAAQNLTLLSPIPQIDNLVLWVEPVLEDSLVSDSTNRTPRDGHKIKAWHTSNSAIGVSGTLSQTNTNFMPTYVKNGIGGIPAVKFDPDGDMLFTTSPPLKAASQTYTIIWVWSMKAPSSQITFLTNGNYFESVSKRFGIYHWNDYLGVGCSGNTAMTFGSGFTMNTPYISIIMFDNTVTPYAKLHTFSNSNTRVSSNQNAAYPCASSLIGDDVFSIGRFASSSDPSSPPAHLTSNSFNGMFSEIAVYDRALEDEEIAEINAYLSRKYKIIVN